MSAKVYAVLSIDTTTQPATVRGVATFGDPNPTTNLKFKQVELFRIEADDYATAESRACEMISNPYYDWCGELEIKDGRATRSWKKPA